MKKQLLIVILVAMLALTSVDLALTKDESTIGSVFTSEVVPCPAEITGGLGFNPGPYVDAYGLKNLITEVEGKTYECGVVYVPENYAKPEGRIIGLFYLHLFSFNNAPAPDPVIYLSGGPGGSGSLDGAGNPLELNNMNLIRQKREVIAYDQRGTGWSNYLLCAPFTSAIGILLERTHDPKIAALLKDLSTSSTASSALQTALCGTVYTTLTDVDLTQYNSVASAQDILHLTETLGYTKGYNLYGTSYGTRLAQNAMRSTPDSIRSVVLDGPTGPNDNNSFSTVAKFVTPYVNIFAYCAADPKCNAAYPNLSARFSALLGRLSAKPLIINPPILGDIRHQLPPIIDQIDPGFFIALATINNDFSLKGYASIIPRTILALEQGDIEYLRATFGLPADLQNTVASPAIPQSASSSPELVPVDQPFFQASVVNLIGIAQAMAGADLNNLSLDMAWVAVVLKDMEARLVAGDAQADVLEDLINWSVLPNGSLDAQRLVDFANAHLTPEAAKAANVLVARMTRNDLRQTMWGIQDIAMGLGAPPDRRAFSTVLQTAVNCAEDIPFATMDELKAYLNTLPFQELIIPAEQIEALPVGCISFPTALDESITAPVKSAIPTLVYVVGVDTHTPSTWGVNIRALLSNSYLVEWQNIGHVIVTKDGPACSGAIAAAFLDNPKGELDTSCSRTDTYTVNFVLPK